MMFLKFLNKIRCCFLYFLKFQLLTKLFLITVFLLTHTACIGEVSIIDIALNSKIIESTTWIYFFKLNMFFFQISLFFFVAQIFFNKKICQLDLAASQNVIRHNIFKTNLLYIFRTKQK